MYAELAEDLKPVYECVGKELSRTATAYLRSRQADPLCSFGDFVAISEVVDVSTAQLLKIEVSDGIIAAGYEPEALEILKAKKGGKYIVLQADPAFEPPLEEQRTIFGTSFRQARAAEAVGSATLDNVVTAKKELSEAEKRDLLLAQIAIKYTQSNSVGYAKDGQMIGVGAGQQSRVDCVKLAGRKVETWWLRQHPKVRALAFKEGVKRQERINARVRYIEGDMTSIEYAQWCTQFDTVPEPLKAEEKAAFLKTLNGVCLVRLPPSTLTTRHYPPQPPATIHPSHAPPSTPATRRPHLSLPRSLVAVAPSPPSRWPPSAHSLGLHAHYLLSLRAGFRCLLPFPRLDRRSLYAWRLVPRGRGWQRCRR